MIDIIGNIRYEIIRLTANLYRIKLDEHGTRFIELEASFDDIGRLIDYLNVVRMSMPKDTIEAIEKHECMKCGKSVSINDRITINFEYGHKNCILGGMPDE